MAEGEKVPEIIENLMKTGENNKRKRFIKFSPRKFIFLRKQPEVKLSWRPGTKLGREAMELIQTRNEEFNKFNNAEQGLLVAFLANRFPGGGKICKKCGSGETVTRGHLRRCHFSKGYYKKAMHTNLQKHMVSCFRLFGRIRQMI